MPTDAFLCIGAAHWDLIARARSEPAPGADLPGRIEERPGGVALNIARAIAERGGHAILLAAVGRDPAGDRLVEALTAQGIDGTHLIRTSVATDRYVGIEGPDGALFAAVADCSALESTSVDLLGLLLAGSLANAWIVLDGNLPDRVLRTVLGAACSGSSIALVAASPAKATRLAALLRLRPLTLYLNRVEAEAICGSAFPDSRAAAEALVVRGAAGALVTDGPRAAAHATPGSMVSLIPPAVIASSVTGAGDVLVASHLLALADGLEPEAALEGALAAAVRHVAPEVA